MSGWCRIHGHRYPVLYRQQASGGQTAASAAQEAQGQKAGRKITSRTLQLASWLLLITTLDAKLECERRAAAVSGQMAIGIAVQTAQTAAACGGPALSRAGGVEATVRRC